MFDASAEFFVTYCRLYNVLNATCVLVGHYLLDLLEYTHTFLFCPTQSIGLKICVRLFSLRLRTVGGYLVLALFDTLNQLCLHV